MSLLHVAMIVAAQKKKSSHQKYKASRCYEKKEEEYSYSPQPKYCFMDYVMEELVDKESALYKFFDILYKEHKEVLKEDIERKKVQIEEYSKEVESKIPHIIEFQEEAKKLGLDIEFCMLESFTKEKELRLLVGDNYAYSEEVFDESGKGDILFRKVEDILKAEKSEKEAEDSHLRELSLKIALAKKDAQRSIFKKKQKLHVVSELETEYRTVKSKYDRRNIVHERRIDALERFLSLEEHHKDLLIKGVDELTSTYSKREEIKKISKDVKEREDAIRIDSVYPEAMEKAMERLAQKGVITTELLEKVFLLLDKIYKKYQRKELKHIHPYYNDSKKSTVRWFIHDVYGMDENYVKTSEKSKKKVL